MRLQLRRVLAAATVLTVSGAASAQPVPETKEEKAAAPPPDAPPGASGSSVSGVVVRGASEFSSYADTDHVFVQTPTVAVSAESPTAGWSLGGSYLVDVVSAASADIVSTASRRWEEVRQGGTLDAGYKPGNFGIAASGNVSVEPDYLSWTAGGTLTQDVFEKNVALVLGYSHGHDVAGRSGTPFSVFSHPLDRDWFKLGATMILDRASVLSLVADVVLENGDPSKPYRYIPMFAPGATVPNGATIDQVDAVRLNIRTLEQLPLTRQRYALSARYAHRFRASTLRLDERLYGDSWALLATSTDARFLIDVGRRSGTGPHLRIHAQKPVDFWKRTYVVGTGFDFPALRTGDRELGPLANFTAGWTFRFALGSDAHPESWILGIDLNATETRYFDDLYITNRLAGLGTVTLETEL
jgi:hypothetical protein